MYWLEQPCHDCPPFGAVIVKYGITVNVALEVSAIDGNDVNETFTNMREEFALGTVQAKLVAVLETTEDKTVQLAPLSAEYSILKLEFGRYCPYQEIETEEPGDNCSPPFG